MRCKHYLWMVGVACLTIMHNAHAEVGYVTDQLVLGVRSSKTASQPFQSIVSGTEVEIVSREGKHTLVKLANGKKGWVRTGYLVADKPALVKMPELTQQAATLTDQYSKTQQTLTETQQRLQSLAQRTAQKSAQLSERERNLQELQAKYNALINKVGDLEHPISANWLVITALVAFLLGIYISYKVVDFKIRKRYYGYRIY